MASGYKNKHYYNYGKHGAAFVIQAYYSQVKMIELVNPHKRLAISISKGIKLRSYPGLKFTIRS